MAVRRIETYPEKFGKVQSNFASGLHGAIYDKNLDLFPTASNSYRYPLMRGGVVQDSFHVLAPSCIFILDI